MWACFGFMCVLELGRMIVRDQWSAMHCPIVCHSVYTLVWSGGWGQSKTFSRNMTIPEFHSSASRWYKHSFPVRQMHSQEGTYLLNKMFALLLNVTVRSVLWQEVFLQALQAMSIYCSWGVPHRLWEQLYNVFSQRKLFMWLQVSQDGLKNPSLSSWTLKVAGVYHLDRNARELLYGKCRI